ncbi:hypothetical protein ACFFK0_25880 [Paenibacillus chartarius]|uniref:Uncharacterized protein n=1 Tax=Paenibacillus chartarius TaxID=747481 RepID=A0ABV6DT62_9BACL
MENNLKMFAGERLLVMTGLLGFLLAAGIAVYMAFYGSVVLPEGNIESAFSFSAAIGIFALSIAAILPIAGLSPRKRASIRWLYIIGFLYAYGLETIQHFRGINPRFSQVGSVGDMIAGILFGLDSLMLIVLTVLLALPFFRSRQPLERPWLVLGIRYAFVSTMIAFAAGLWMTVLQGRYTGDAGNLIVLHGLGFHALQTLPVLGWLVGWAQMDTLKSRRLMHTGGIAWTASVLLVFVQTALGRTVFEPTAIPVLAGLLLLISLGALALAAINALKSRASSRDLLSRV